MSPATTFESAKRSQALALHRIESLPILVLFPHNRCNCRCLMCDIWHLRQAQEITARDLAPHLDSLRSLGVRWVVLSGGEPLMHTDLEPLTRALRAEGIRLTLLTAGLLLEPFARLVADNVDDVIVSLDGPPQTHDKIRNVPRAFERLACGVEGVRRLRPGMEFRGRTTVQKANHAQLRETVRTAKDLKLDSLSFLAADVTSQAFNRPEGWLPERQAPVALGADEVEKLDEEIEALIRENAQDIAAGFIVEDARKLGRIVLHFRAHLKQCAPVAPRCNAPWVSAVVEADGAVRPCFFHRAIGNVREKPLIEVLNGPAALAFRQQLNVAENPICRRCVCSLHLDPSTLDPT